MKKELSELRKSHEETEKTVTEIMTISESMVAEKDALEISFNEQRQATAQIMLARSKEVKLLQEWQNKMKVLTFETMHHFN